MKETGFHGGEAAGVLCAGAGVRPALMPWLPPAVLFHRSRLGLELATCAEIKSQPPGHPRFQELSDHEAPSSANCSFSVEQKSFS